MPRVRLYMHRVNGWEQTTSAVESNSPDMSHMAVPNLKLQDLAIDVKELNMELVTLEARRAEVVKSLRRMLQEGDTLMDLLRTAARQVYGYSSPKLIEFGIQPLRSRPRETEKPTEPPLPETTAPESSAPDTTQ